MRFVCVFLALFCLASPALAAIANPGPAKCACDPACPCGCNFADECECPCGKLDPLAGWYVLHEGEEHAGFVHVTPLRSRYVVVWHYSPKLDPMTGSLTMRVSAHAEAVRCGKALAVSWIAEGGKGVLAAYEIVRDGLVRGTSEEWRKVVIVPRTVHVPSPAALCAARRELPQRQDDPQALLDAGRALGSGFLDWLAQEYDPWPMLPPREECRRRYTIAVEWHRALVDEAKALGYFGMAYGRSPWGGDFLESGDVWCGGGWEAGRRLQEIDEAATLVAFWRAANEIRCGCQDADPAYLIAVIGQADYALGRLPPPMPVWRVSRAAPAP